MSAAPILSVIIVNYNGRDDLRRCLTALAGCGPHIEFIVADNASQDGSAAMVREAFAFARLIEPGRNLYFCTGNNTGLAFASGEYALLLNPDTVVPPGALDAMTSFMQSHPDYAGVTMQMRYPDGGVQQTCSRIASARYLLLTQTALRWLATGAAARAEARHQYRDEGWDRTTERDVEAIPGSCCLMRRAELRLSDRLLLYFNEDDLARRFAGRRFRFLTGPAIEHREKSVTRGITATRLYFRDLVAYARLHHGPAFALLVWLLSRPLLWGILLRRRFRAGGSGLESA